MSKDDDLGTEATEKVRESRTEKAAIGHTAAGYNKHRRNTDEAEHRNGWDRTRRKHEEEMGWHMADGHTMVKANGSEPHEAAHTTAMAHPAKRDEKHKHTNEDDGQRKMMKRDDDVEYTMVGVTAQPGDDTRGEQSGAASHYSYRSRDTSKISADAKSSFIQKRNFYDFGIEKKRERDPG